MTRTTRKLDGSCPYINLDDSRCAKHFTLGHLTQAFHVCLDGYAACPTYQQLRAEEQGYRFHSQPQVRLTISGRDYFDPSRIRAAAS